MDAADVKTDEFLKRIKAKQLGENMEGWLSFLTRQHQYVFLAVYNIVKVAIEFGGLTNDEIIQKYGPPPE